MEKKDGNLEITWESGVQTIGSKVLWVSKII